MAIKFASILAVLGLGSPTEAVTEAHLEAADAKIAQLTLDKSASDLKASNAEAALQLAKDEQTKTATDLKEAQDKAATLQTWKDNQAQVDGRAEDDSNKLDAQPEAQDPWEKVSASAIASAKKRLGGK